MTDSNQPFTLAQRHNGDAAYASFTHFPRGGVHEQFTAAFDIDAGLTLSGPLSDWMDERGREKFKISAMFTNVIIAISDEDLAFEFRMTYC